MSNRQSFAAYGVSIESELDLGDDLRDGYRGGLVVRLEKMPRDHSTGVTLRPVSGFEAHGRTVTFLSDAKGVSDQKGRYWQFKVDGLLSFFWRAGDDTIHYNASGNVEVQRIAFWFVHMVLPIVLSGGMSMNIIHAASVDMSGKAAAFLAPTGGGKSTLADFLVQRGHGLISDDKLVVLEEGGEFLALPSHACHRPYRSNEDLGKRAVNVVREPRPLTAIFSLHRVRSVDSAEVQEVRGADRFAELNEALLYKLPFKVVAQTAFLGRLANHVPVYRAHVPDALDRLPELYELISEAV